eukprot:351543-Chlamydomonas_euryale.AAC.3
MLLTARQSWKTRPSVPASTKRDTAHATSHGTSAAHGGSNGDSDSCACGGRYATRPKLPGTPSTAPTTPGCPGSPPIGAGVLPPPYVGPCAGACSSARPETAPATECGCSRARLPPVSVESAVPAASASSTAAVERRLRAATRRRPGTGSSGDAPPGSRSPALPSRGCVTMTYTKPYVHA